MSSHLTVPDSDLPRTSAITSLPADAATANEKIVPFQTDENQYVVPIYGYASPVLIIITVVTNCLVCAVLLRKNMRSPTNALLVAIAAADLLTGVLPAPCFFYFYTAEKYRDWVRHLFVATY